VYKSASHQDKTNDQQTVAKIAPNMWWQNHREEIHSVVQILSGLATVGILGFTIVYSYYACRQANSSERAANAAATNANAALQQAHIADEAMRVSERPYVQIGKSPKGNVAEWVTERGVKTGVIVYFQNAGNTPALRFYVNGCISGTSTANCHPNHLEPSWTTARNSNGQPFGMTYLGGSISGSRSLVPIPVPNLNRQDISRGLSH
jgi:hypothetical protein